MFEEFDYDFIGFISELTLSPRKFQSVDQTEIAKLVTS